MKFQQLCALVAATFVCTSAFSQRDCRSALVEAVSLNKKYAYSLSAEGNALEAYSKAIFNSKIKSQSKARVVKATERAFPLCVSTGNALRAAKTACADKQVSHDKSIVEFLAGGDRLTPEHCEAEKRCAIEDEVSSFCVDRAMGRNK